MKTYRVVVERNGVLDVAYVEADKMEDDARGLRFLKGKEQVGAFKKHLVAGWSIVKEM